MALYGKHGLMLGIEYSGYRSFVCADSVVLTSLHSQIADCHGIEDGICTGRRQRDD